jgi:hypothetical protein
MRTADESKVKKFFESGNTKFIQACGAVKLTPTRRQASKWLNKKGIAYKEGRFA